MPKMTEEARRQIARQVVEILDNHDAELLAAGYDPANRKAELTTKAETAAAREADQVTARVAWRMDSPFRATRGIQLCPFPLFSIAGHPLVDQ